MLTPSEAAPIEAVPAQTSPRFYRPELDVLRVAAFLLVFVHHSLSGDLGHGLLRRITIAIRDMGAFGVCLFFLLSAYLITELLLKEQRKTNSIHIKAFYVRRILRIWPLYFLILLVGYIFGAAGLNEPISTGRLLAFILLAGNWYTAQYGSIRNIMFPLWSISVEEQYYLFWPTVAKYGRKRGMFLFAAAMWLVSFAVLAFLSAHNAPLNTTIWANSFVQFQFFSLGAVAALVLDGKMPEISKLRFPLIAGGVLLYFAAAFFFQIKRDGGISSLAQTVPGYLVANIGTLLIFYGTLGAKLPGYMKPFAYLGKISYGLYAYHQLATYVTRIALKQFIPQLPRGSSLFVMPIALLLTALLATVSYKFVESPFLKLKERFAFVRSRQI